MGEHDPYSICAQLAAKFLFIANLIFNDTEFLSQFNGENLSFMLAAHPDYIAVLPKPAFNRCDASDLATIGGAHLEFAFRLLNNEFDFNNNASPEDYFKLFYNHQELSEKIADYASIMEHWTSDQLCHLACKYFSFASKLQQYPSLYEKLKWHEKENIKNSHPGLLSHAHFFSPHRNASYSPPPKANTHHY